ncbi:MAG: ATP-binding cassette domain-containing protein [Candidatus Zapsychrus exili]|nr:ATP-binding cassette domain-containing protein [Candidatus Zapsychrus exili]
MITINNVTMGFTGRTLFRDVTLSIFPNEKIGLTGPNGSGKTTLFSIILGNMEPLVGNIQMQRNMNIGYLPQESSFKSDRTVMEELIEGDDRIKNLMSEKRKLEDEHKADSNRYGDILHELEQLGVYEIEHKVEKILTGLGFEQETFHKPISQLSGGWQMRTLLAKLLAYPYNLLLLDEPTNYLDLSATLWLKDFLKNYDGAFVLISHDRVFLNDVTNYTIVLDGPQLMKVKGNYETFEHQREIDQKTLEKRKKVVDKKRKQLEQFAQRFHAQPNRASAVRNKRKMIDKLETIDLAHDKKSMGEFEFSQLKSSGYVVAYLNKISKSYGEKQVYRDLDFEVTRGQRICLVGSNGAGKSTLLKMLAGALKQDSGTLKYGHNVELGYFSQSRLDVLNPDRTVFEEVASVSTAGVPSLKIRTLLGLFNFHGDDVFKTVRILSGGEKSRVILAKLLIKPPNFMLLDEPTTHLDLDGVKALTDAFKEYDATLVFISHDLYFIREVADCIVDVSGGGIKIYPGGLDYYLDKKQQSTLDVKSKKKQVKSGEKNSSKKSKKQKGEKSDSVVDKLHAQHKQALKRISQIKKEIKALEKEREDLETESYVKSRHLSKSFDKQDKEVLKSYGRRLKDIQSRMREIESTIKSLIVEKENIQKVKE